MRSVIMIVVDEDYPILRTERYAHPMALRKGDHLATGYWVLEYPLEITGGRVNLHLIRKDCNDRMISRWYVVDSRLPIALYTKTIQQHI